MKKFNKRGMTKKLAALFLIVVFLTMQLVPPAVAAAPIPIPVFMDTGNFSSSNVGRDFDSTLIWARGDAGTASGVLRVVPAYNDMGGTVVRRGKVRLSGGFSTYFVLNLNGGSIPPADGLVFSVQKNDAPLLGVSGGGLGYRGIPNSLGVEFDIYNNGGMDGSHGVYDNLIMGGGDNHIAIVQNGSSDHSSENANTWSVPGFSLHGNDVHVWIDYEEDGTLHVAYGLSDDYSAAAKFSKNVGTAFKDQEVFAGFSASTGGSTANHDIKEWYFSNRYVSGGLSPAAGAYTQGASSVEISMNPVSADSISVNVRVKDIANNNIANDVVALYLDGNPEPAATLNTGSDGTQANYDFSGLPEGSHTIKAVATDNGGAADIKTFVITGGGRLVTVTPPSGVGSEYEPFIINQPGNLLWLSENSGGYWGFSGKYFRQTADIDMAGIDFAPIGTAALPFGGTYNGNGYKISNLHIDNEISDYTGLFGSQAGYIKNVILENVTMVGSNYVGGMAGFNGGVIEQSSITGSSMLTGTGNIGGIAGYNNGSISFSTNRANIGGTSKFAGGIAGRNLGSVNDCLNTGSITSGLSAEAAVGGVIGTSSGSVRNTLNLGNVTAESGSYMGGIIGSDSDNQVSDNYFLVSTAVYGIGQKSGVNDPGNTGAEPMSSEDLKVKSTFVGWDFEYIWQLNPAVNDGYPYLGRPSPEFNAVSSTPGSDVLTTTVHVGDTLGKNNRLVLQYSEVPVLTAVYGSMAPTGPDVTDPYVSGDVISINSIDVYLGIYEVDQNNQVIKFSQLIPEYRFMDGDGTAEAPFLITHALQLSLMNNNPDAHFRLTKDIDMSGVTDFIPIGTGRKSGFSGIFDGDNHKISNLSIDSLNYYVGLFGEIYGGTVKNLELNNISITGSGRWSITGGLAASKYYGSISNCRITGNSTVEGTVAGGIIGINQSGSIERSSSNANIVLFPNPDPLQFRVIGGIAGFNVDGSISLCYNTGNVTGSNDTYTGGIVGMSYYEATIRECYNTGNVEGGDGSKVGGIVGMGGLGIVTDSYNKGDTAGGAHAFVGGISGKWGLVEFFGDDPDDQSAIRNSYSTGAVTGGDNESVGGITGYLQQGILENSFYLQEAGADIYGRKDTLDVYDTKDFARTAEQLKSKDEYTNSGWDFTPDTGVWDIGSAINQGYPYLQGLTVKLAPRSLGIAGDGRITGLSPGFRYILRIGTDIKYVKANGTLSQWEADAAPLIGTEITGLINRTTYFVQISPSKNTGGKDDISTATISSDFLINGKTQSLGTVFTTKVGDKTVTTITLDPQKVEDVLKSSGNNTVVTISVSGKSDVVVSELDGAILKHLEDKEAVLAIKTDFATYTLPASQINIDTAAQSLGAGELLSNIKVIVQVASPPAEAVRIVEDTANKNHYTVVVKPVEFNITCTYGDKTVEVSRFNGFVERTVAIPDGVDPSKITTGIVLNPDGTFSHVPTRIIVIDGKYYAKIESLTNSVYSVIWNSQEFSDVENHWAKEAVNDMGSRLVVSGVGSDRFEPGRGITRAEFAAIMVKALGLRPGTGKNSFSDVKATDWYSGSIATAVEYGIVSGYSNGKFGPNEKITREQAMTIIAKAMKITELDTQLTNTEAEKLVAGFSDAGNISAYAKPGIAACIKAGIVHGQGSNMVAPGANITRAEAAVMVRLLLQKSELI